MKTPPDTSAFKKDVLILARGGFLPRRCWIFFDGIHVPSLHSTRPRIAAKPWESETGFPLWINMKQTPKIRGILRTPCLVRVDRGVIREYDVRPTDRGQG